MQGEEGSPTRKTLDLVLSYSAAILLSACSDRGVPNTPPSPAAPDNQPVALVVSPNSGRIGSPISIRDSSVVPRSNYLIGFPGADDLLVASSDSLSTIHAFVPFGARSGRISVDMGSRQGLTQPFVVQEISDTLALRVAPYDIVPPVAPADSGIVDFNGVRRAWQAAVSGDSVHISVRYSTGDDIREIHFILLNSGVGSLPEFLGGWTYIKFDYPGSRTIPITTGLLKTQDWNINGVMSGRFFGRLSNPVLPNGAIAFWIDRSRSSRVIDSARK